MKKILVLGGVDLSKKIVKIDNIDGIEQTYIWIDKQLKIT